MYFAAIQEGVVEAPFKTIGPWVTLFETRWIFFPDPV